MKNTILVAPSKELNHLAAILHVYAGSLIVMKKKKYAGRVFNDGISYDERVKKQPSGYRYKEGLRTEDAPGLVL